MDFAHTNRGKNSRAIFGFWAQHFFGDRMANLDLIDFIIALYIKFTVNKNLKSISNNFGHNGHQSWQK